MKVFKRWLISFFDNVLEDVLNDNFKAKYYGGMVLLSPFFMLYLYWKLIDIN